MNPDAEKARRTRGGCGEQSETITGHLVTLNKKADQTRLGLTFSQNVTY